MSELLSLTGVRSGYGDAIVIDDMTFSLDAGECMALLGRNGVGKTTLLATLIGAADLQGGEITFAGRAIARVRSQQRAQLGIGWVPQERDVFPSLTVEENLTVVARKGEWSLAKVYGIFPRLEERRRNMGNQLSGGEQQMLAIGRALMLNPKLLLLDEPLEGLAPIIVQELLNVIRGLIETSGMSVILVEQHASKILPLAQRALVLERGKTVYWGRADTLRNDPQCLERWLGVQKSQGAVA